MLRFINLACLLGLALSVAACDSGPVGEANHSPSNASSSSLVNTTSSWDWRDDSAYEDYNGNQIPSPWLRENHIGVSLIGSDKCQPSDGWNLYIKRMTATDFYSTQASQKDTAPENPYFVLYNEHTGVARVFFYLGGDNTVGEDYFTFQTSVVDGGGQASDLGLFLNDAGQFSSPLSQKSGAINEDRSGFLFETDAIYKKWLVLDYQLSYDPSIDNYNNVFIEIGVGAVDEETIELQGSFDFTQKEVTRNGQNIISALVSSITGSSGKIKRRIDDVNSFQENVSEIGSDLGDDPGIIGDIGNSLTDFANFIGPATDIIGFSAGALEYVSSVTNLFGGGSTQTSISIGEGSMELSGTITDNFTVTRHSFGIPAVGYSNPDEEPVFQEKVGLFSLDQTPQVTLTRKQFTYQCKSGYYGGYSPHDAYGLYIDYADQNMGSLFNVNPESEMNLVDVKASPIVEVRGGFFGYQTYSPSYDPIYEGGFSIQRYSYDGPSGGIFTYQTSTYRDVRVKSYSKYSDGYLAAGIDPLNFPDQVSTTGGASCQSTYSIRPQPGDVKIRYYLKFEHPNKDITTEFVRTYKADVDLGEKY